MTVNFNYHRLLHNSILYAFIILACMSCNKPEQLTQPPDDPITPTETPIPPPDASKPYLVYASRDGALYEVNTDASIRYKMTDRSMSSRGPNVSPDGRFVAYFASSSTNNPGLYIMHSDGTKGIRCAEVAGQGQYYPLFSSWSADNNTVYFTSPKAGFFQIFSVQVDGRNERKVTSLDQAMLAVASPSSSYLAFIGANAGYGAIWIQDLNSTAQARLLSTSGVTSNPIWSPDGIRLAITGNFDSPPDPGYADVFVAAVNQGSFTRLTTDRCSGVRDWSLNGTSILFVSSRSGQQHLYAMNVDGTQQTQLPTSPGELNHAYFSPDSKKIAYEVIVSAGPPPRMQLFTMNLDGSNQIMAADSITGFCWHR